MRSLPSNDARSLVGWTHAAVDASGTFRETKRQAGLLRMMQAGVIMSDYARLIVFFPFPPSSLFRATFFFFLSLPPVLFFFSFFFLSPLPFFPPFFSSFFFSFLFSLLFPFFCPSGRRTGDVGFAPPLENRRQLLALRHDALRLRSQSDAGIRHRAR